jgi:MbtH protein
MNEQSSSSDRRYKVVKNHEDQYSIWDLGHGKWPPGWEEVGETGTREECLAYIEKVWTDMRPRSIRWPHPVVSTETRP